MVDDVGDDLEDRRAQADGAGAADDEPWAARPARTMEGAIMLVSLAPGPVRPPGRVEVGLAEHVVQLDAGAGDDEAGAAAGRGRERRRLAVHVHDADVGRRGHAGRLGHGLAQAGARVLDRVARRARRPGAVPPPPRWSSVTKLPPRARAASRMASASRAIASALPAGGGRPQPVEDAERERDQQAAGGRRRVRDELRSAVGRAHGPALDDAVGGEILLGHRPASLPDRRAHAARELAAVEDVGALRRQPLERRRRGRP